MNKKKLLILTVGGSEEPLIKAIYKVHPDLVYFIHSEKSLKKIKPIKDAVDFEFESKCKLLIDYQSLEASFNVSKEIIEDIDENIYDVFVNFTGGTKPMTAGIVLASFNKNYEYSYVATDSDEGRDKDGVGIVKDGFEVIKIQDNPFEIYAINEFENGKRYFNLYQFDAAYKNFEEAERKSQDENLKKLASFYKKIVSFYDSWDKFNNKHENLILPKYYNDIILKELDDDEALLNNFKSDECFYNKFLENQDFLEKKISHKNKNILRNIHYYLPDLLNNACRRIEEGKYDDAVARLYRSIELIAQIGLKNHGFIDEDALRINNVFHINNKSFNELANYEAKEEVKSWKEYNHNKKTFKIPSSKSHNLLQLLGDDFADDYLNDKHFKNLVNNRNNSILAHGLNPISEDNAVDLYGKVLNYARDLDHTIDKYMDLSKFPKFNVDD